jgi:putative DNA primase/helicase
MKENGYDFEPVFDGNIHRFKVGNRSDKSGWFVGHKIQVNDKKDCHLIIYGDFSKNETLQWKSSGRFSESEKIKRDGEIKRITDEFEKNKKIRQEQASELAKQEWEKAEYINGVLPKYFENKKLTKNFNLKTKDESVIIPVYENFDGRITSYQTIAPDGQKLFVKDGAIKGNFHYIIGNSDKILVCEGFATGASLFEVTGHTVVVSFFASNLMPVCEKLLQNHKSSQILICADNDHLRTANVGVSAAEEVSKKLGIKFIYPEFPDGSTGTDFNDLMISDGKTAVLKYFEDTTKVKKSLQTIWADLDLTVDVGPAPNYLTNVVENLDNVVKILSCHELFKNKIWYDEFKGQILTNSFGKTREWVDADDYSVTQIIQSQFGLKTISDYVVRKACMLVASKDTRNEPQIWIKSLKWDGEERIAEFFHNSMGSDANLYTQCASRNFWVSLTARILRPGCKVDNMVILEGAQGAMKSTALRVIAGHDWFAEVSQDPNSKDFYLNILGKSLIEISELESFSKADTLAIKRVVSCQVDRYRVPHDKYAKDNPRKCIFVGTTNDTEYLKDATGNRRFWPIEVSKINIPYIEKYREQLYAEAAYCFMSGQKWWEMPEDETKSVAGNKVQQDAWHDKVKDYLLGKDEVKIYDIAASCLEIKASQMDRRVTLRLAGILKILGWKSECVKEDGRVRRAWQKK